MAPSLAASSLSQPGRLKTFRTSNGSSFRVELEGATELRCPADHKWLQQVRISTESSSFMRVF